jgi:hypothetical protein
VTRGPISAKSAEKGAVAWSVPANSDSSGLWAHTVRGVPAEALAVYKAHLGGNVVQPFRVSQQLFASARARVLQDAERMAFLERYGNDGVAEAFTPNPHRGACILCSFQRLCPGGRAFLDD